MYLRVGTILSDLGDARESRRSYQAAPSLYDKLAKANPEDRPSQAGLATCLFRTGDYVSAIKILEKLHEAEPANPRFRRDLSEAYNSLAIRQGDEEKNTEQSADPRKSAWRCVKGLVREFPEDVEYRTGTGRDLEQSRGVSQCSRTLGRCSGDVPPRRRARGGGIREDPQ